MNIDTHTGECAPGGCEPGECDPGECDPGGCEPVGRQPEGCDAGGCEKPAGTERRVTHYGGWAVVFNKTGETIASMYADEYGNGVVYAGNRKGEGRTLEPGP
jgi:hypothetical protein